MSLYQVVSLLETQKKHPIVCEYGVGHFRLTDQGVFFIGTDKDGSQLPPRWISSLLNVVAKTRYAKSGEWADYWNGRMMMALPINGRCLWLYCKEILLMSGASWQGLA